MKCRIVEINKESLTRGKEKYYIIERSGFWGWNPVLVRGGYCSMEFVYNLEPRKFSSIEEAEKAILNNEIFDESAEMPGPIETKRLIKII